ncbi:MAG: AsmA family protein, partial [Deltaproteobacteria bacterium]|nr:AsmA family protein [Deltaproteobacteria bacterium]
MRALLRRAALTLAALPVVLVAIVLLLLSLGITVRLDPLRPTFEAAVSSALGREVALEGSMVLVPTFSPTVEVQGLRIANPPDWPTPDFARMELARLQIGVLPLLWERRLQVREFTAEGVSLLLHRAAGGEANWDFAGLESPAEPAEPEEPEKAEAPPDPEEIRERLLTAAELEELRLRDIEVHYRDDTSGEDVVFTLNELFAEVATDLPSKLSMQGAFRAHPFSVSLTTGNPMDLLTGDEAWPLELTLEIAGTTLQLSGQLDEGPLPDLGASGEPPPAEAAPEAGRRFGELSLSLRGERLSSLDELVGVALPPLGPYSFEGHFRAFAGKRYEAEVVIGVGTSRLEGTMKLAAVQPPPRVEIDLATETVQLDDFDAGAWS